MIINLTIIVPRKPNVTKMLLKYLQFWLTQTRLKCPDFVK